jgi:hypothetical protein
MNKVVGELSGEVSDQYPCWCEISVNNESIRFTHKDLSDLEYLVSEMIKDAKRKLGNKVGAEV